jgi:uncharacterized protein (TIGR00369 family)
VPEPDLAQLKKRQEQLIALFAKAPIKHTFGMDLSYDDDSNAIFRLPYNDGLDHALGAIHGGVLATLLDNAGWFTVAARYNTWISTAELQVRLLEPVAKTAVVAKGTIIRAGKRIAMAEMEVRSGEGDLIVSRIVFRGNAVRG